MLGRAVPDRPRGRAGGWWPRRLCALVVVTAMAAGLGPRLVGSAPVAAQTRGISVTAADRASGRTAEVQLYRKAYAVVIGIDRYPNLPPDRQLSYAVRDAKGVAATLARHFAFDRRPRPRP